MELALDTTYITDDYDPLAESELIEADGEEEKEPWEYIGEIEKPIEGATCYSDPALTPKEKMDELIIGLPGRRKVLLSFIEFCREPKSVSECDGKIDELQAHNHSVYTPVVIRQMLELAGAIEYVQGDAIGGEVDDNGGEYLTVVKRGEGTWVATADGIAYAEACSPSKELEALLDKEPEYMDVYKLILRYCIEEPRDKKDLDLLIDAEEKCQKPRRFSGYFVDRLEKCGAMEWDGLWKTTEIGQSVL